MLFCGKLFLVLSAVTILTQVVAFVNDFVGKVVKAGTGARRPVGSFSSSKLYKIDILYNLGEQHFTNSWLFKRIFVKPARSSVLAQPNVLRFSLLK